MPDINYYNSPIGRITMAAEKNKLSGLWLEGQKYYASTLKGVYAEKELEIFRETKAWLDIYFSGKSPDFMPSILLEGSEFQLAVWHILQKIPYGEAITYGEIAKEIALQRGMASMSAQAVGGAVGHNPISIIVPCHRVVGVGKSMTGYAGGVEKKRYLLNLEGFFNFL